MFLTFLYNSQTTDNMELDLKNTGIVYNQDISGSREFAAEISDSFFISGLTKHRPKFFDMENMPDDATFIIAIGGDGTLLKCARKYSRLNVPVFGFNMGRRRKHCIK